MIFKKIPSWVLVLLLLMIIVGAALWLRVALPYNQVFVNDWVKLTGVDDPVRSVLHLSKWSYHHYSTEFLCLLDGRDSLATQSGQT